MFDFTFPKQCNSIIAKWRDISLVLIAWFFGHCKELEGAFSTGADLQEWAFCPHFQLWFELSSPPPANPFDWTPAHNSSILIVVNIGASWSTIIYTVRLPKRVRLQKKRCGFDVRCGYRISAAMVRFAGAVGVRLRIWPETGFITYSKKLCFFVNVW